MEQATKGIAPLASRKAPVGSLLAQVAIYGLAAALAAPVAAVVSAVILGKSARPVLSTWTFVAGAAFLDLAFAAVILALDLFENGGDAGAIVDVLLGLLFAGMGLLAVFQKESPEKEAAQRARVDKIATAKLSMLFAAGFLVQVINFDAIAVFGGALKDIGEADISTGQEIFATLFGVAIMLSVYYIPVLIYMIDRKRAVPLLARMTEWIMSNLRRIEIVVGLGFGIYFLAKGLTVLL
jgi:Sap-like sulfolipid-1-addressing protein